jgi:hypothetical protein
LVLVFATIGSLQPRKREFQKKDLRRSRTVNGGYGWIFVERLRVNLINSIRFLKEIFKMPDDRSGRSIWLILFKLFPDKDIGRKLASPHGRILVSPLDGKRIGIIIPS